MAPKTVTVGDIPLPTPPSAKARTPALMPIAVAAYALMVALTIRRHEPWADEAQSWLLGRDTSLAQLWGHLLHYEGTPGLWQTLVHALIRVGLPYGGYNFVSAGLGFAAVVLLVRYAPLPLFIRISLPFTYYLCYQYAVIARSYALIAPLLFAIAVIYTQAPLRPALMTVLLALLAGVSVHGFLISACIWVTLYGPQLLGWGQLQASERMKVAIAGLTYWCILVFFLICAWPAKDVAFAEHRGLANLHLFPDVAKAGLAGAFTGYWITSLVLIALSLPLLWRGGGLLFFALASAAFFLFGTIVYTQLWHFGVLFLAWVFAIWISAYKTRVTVPTLLALTVAIGFQCYWTAAAIRYDWGHAYSGSLAAAQYFQQAGLPSGGLYTIGYSSTALQPYFSANLYSDFHGGASEAYWDWSKRNTVDDPVALIGSNRRESVMVGYKAMPEKQRWADLLHLLGYSPTRHFDGATFWQTDVFEFESYDLYRKTSDPQAASSVDMADTSQAGQLLSGVHAIEAGKWRWTAKNFSILLKAPPGSIPNGAELTLKLVLPEVQLRSLGPITIRADVSGRELPALRLSKPDAYVYSAHVPAEALESGLAAVNFRLDKAAMGVNGDARELGVVVIAVSLDPAHPAP
jgi:hypothetical protein